jgi:hypothetical protein
MPKKVAPGINGQPKGARFRMLRIKAVPMLGAAD